MSRSSRCMTRVRHEEKGTLSRGWACSACPSYLGLDKESRASSKRGSHKSRKGLFCPLLSVSRGTLDLICPVIIIRNQAAAVTGQTDQRQPSYCLRDRYTDHTHIRGGSEAAIILPEGQILRSYAHQGQIKGSQHAVSWTGQADVSARACVWVVCWMSASISWAKY
eukprot:1160718-Pelagomonas_calceolata.AAC.5